MFEGIVDVELDRIHAGNFVAVLYCATMDLKSKSVDGSVIGLSRFLVVAWKACFENKLPKWALAESRPPNEELHPAAAGCTLVPGSKQSNYWQASGR